MRGVIDRLKHFRPLLLALILQGCGSSVSGEVRDADSGRPVADARVEVTTIGWGSRDGDLVRAKSFTHRANTDSFGRFEIDVSGGVNLRVAGRGFRTIETVLCSRSPNLVRIGGPFDGADLNKQLRLGAAADAATFGWRFGNDQASVPAAEADLIASRPPATHGHMAGLRAPLGMTFVRGSGNPPAPPAVGYTKSLEIDLLDCGWLLVRLANGGMAAVRTGSYGFDEPLEGGPFVMLSYGELPLVLTERGAAAAP